jgi:hypothetical protein
MGGRNEDFVFGGICYCRGSAFALFYRSRGGDRGWQQFSDKGNCTAPGKFGVYIGATASVAMRNSMVIAAAGFFFLPFFLRLPVIGNHALWLRMLLFMVARGVILFILYPRLLR